MKATLIGQLKNIETKSSYIPVAEAVEPQTAQPAANAIDGDFLFAGRAVFTIQPAAEYLEKHTACKPHYTFKVSEKEGTYQGKPQTTYFVSLLSGPDNENDYQYIGILKLDGSVITTKASRFLPESYPVTLLNRVCTALVNGKGDKIAAGGWKVHHEGKCGRCARTLTVPESVEYGIGPECRRKMQGA